MVGEAIRQVWTQIAANLGDILHGFWNDDVIDFKLLLSIRSLARALLRHWFWTGIYSCPGSSIAMVPEKTGLRCWLGYVGPKYRRSVKILCSERKPLLTPSSIPIGVIWPVIVDQLINNRQLSLGWTLRTIGFLQLFLMMMATLLVSARFPRIPQEPIPVKQFLADKRTTLFTLSTLIFFFAVYIPYVRIESDLASICPRTRH